MSSMFRVDDNAYDAYMGRYAVKLAVVFAEFAGVREGQRALDVGAGTGALTSELIRRGVTAAAAEPSPDFAAALRRRMPDLEVVEAPAEQLPFADDSFDVALAQLVFAFVSDGPAAAREMARVARTVAICMWGIQEVDMFAAIEVAASEIGTDYHREPPRYRTQAELVELLEPYGDVEAAPLDVTARYSGYDDFWAALSGGVGPAGAWLNSLDDAQRRQAHDILHREFGNPDGPFELNGRAYAARVTRA
jgi:SAM-dependent methyltransferase